MDLGFIQAGHRVVWANDIDPECVKTYRSNIGSHIQHGDVTDMNPKALPDAEIVMGGSVPRIFPC